MEPLWSPVVATGGNQWQIGSAPKPVGFRNSVGGRRAGSARRSIASRFPNFGGYAWAGRSSIWDSAGCCDWSRCCANRSVRRNSRSCCCDMSWRCCAGSRGGNRFDPSATAERLVRLVGTSRDGSALAPAAGQATLDVSAQAAGAAAARSSGTGTRRSTRAREPVLGLPANRRRTARPWHLHLRDVAADDPHPPRSAAGAAARRALMAQLPPPPRGDDARLRFLHRRDRLAEADLRPLLPLARAPPGRVRRLQPEPDRRLDSPTGAQPADDAP
jgi:hypothetical protein